MKLKALIIVGLSALALSSFSAAAAMGEERYGSEVTHLYICAETANSLPSMADCAPPITGTREELKPLEARIVPCLESHPEMQGTGRAFAEYCIAVARSSATATISSKARRARYLHKVAARNAR